MTLFPVNNSLRCRRWREGNACTPWGLWVCVGFETREQKGSIGNNRVPVCRDVEMGQRKSLIAGKNKLACTCFWGTLRTSNKREQWRLGWLLFENVVGRKRVQIKWKMPIQNLFVQQQEVICVAVCVCIPVTTEYLKQCGKGGFPPREVGISVCVGKLGRGLLITGARTD